MKNEESFFFDRILQISSRSWSFPASKASLFFPPFPLSTRLWENGFHMTEHGMQQISHSPPPGQGHSRQLVFGADGLMMEVVEVVELVDDGGSILILRRGFGSGFGGWIGGVVGMNLVGWLFSVSDWIGLMVFQSRKRKEIEDWKKFRVTDSGGSQRWEWQLWVLRCWIGKVCCRRQGFGLRL